MVSGSTLGRILPSCGVQVPDFLQAPFSDMPRAHLTPNQPAAPARAVRLDFILRRLRIVALLCVAGLLPAPLAALLPQDAGGTLVWLLDLACHWQWLFAAGLVISALGCAMAIPRWALLVPLAALPWLSASPVLPAAAAGAEVFSIASANVHFDNADPRALLAWVESEQPDVLVVLEISPRYAAALGPLRGYPHRRVVPADSPFGIALYSRHPLDQVVATTDADGLPHIEAMVAWQGRRIHLLAVHPMPPISAHFHAERNAKLARWARAAGASRLPTLVAGDLNATPWSTAFNELDALGLRRATGLAPTWPAALHGIIGIPIDHVLASRHWRLVASGRGPGLGSDHLPVIARLMPVGDR